MLGVVQSFEPPWVASLMEVAVVAIVPVALIWAANTAMLGLSRHVYVLATNRQIPSWLGKLNRSFKTPHVAILIAAAIAVRARAARPTSSCSAGCSRSGRRSRSRSPTSR